MAPQSRLLLLAAALLVLLALVAVAGFFLYASGASALVGLPMLAIGAVVVLLIVLTSMAVVFASFNLHDRSQALALPEGSIRAVLALMLVVLFAVLTIYLFGSLSHGELLHLGIIDANSLAQLRRAYGDYNVTSVATADGKTFDVWLRTSASPDGVDFAKQLLVLVGTLVTSISSFYFGSRIAVASVEKADAETTPPMIHELSPTQYARGSGPTEFLVVGKDLAQVLGVKAKLHGKEVLATDIRATASELRFRIDFPADETPGRWTVALKDAHLGERSTDAVIHVS